MIVDNNWITIFSNEREFIPIKVNFTKDIPQSQVTNKEGIKIQLPARVQKFYIELEDRIMVPVGLISFVQEYVPDLVPEYMENIPNSYTGDYQARLEAYCSDIENIKRILPGITLRDDQAIAVRKSLIARRGIIQMPTGSGKSEVMCGIIKSIYNITGKYPTSLVMEPSILLVNAATERYKKYDIPVCRYSDNRVIIENCVNICHPKSLSNDIDSGTANIDRVEVLIGDECHHFSANQFRKPSYSMTNLVYSIGLSASTISNDHINNKRISEYDVNEILAISATGRLLMSMKPGNLIESGRLAEPVLLMIDNKADESIPNNDPSNWHNVQKMRLESDERSYKIAKCAKIFSDMNRKVIILVNTRRWSRTLLNMFYELGISDIVRASYGGGYFEKYDGEDYIEDKRSMEQFNNGECNILIGTQHLYEGADIPNLDVIILGYGGKGERTQIQGIGRALRITKNGKYAYIVDFTDDNDPVLRRHRDKRMSRYRDIISIPDRRIYYGIDVDDVYDIFSNLES